MYSCIFLFSTAERPKYTFDFSEEEEADDDETPATNNELDDFKPQSSPVPNNRNDDDAHSDSPEKDEYDFSSIKSSTEYVTSIITILLADLDWFAVVPIQPLWSLTYRKTSETPKKKQADIFSSSLSKKVQNGNSLFIVLLSNNLFNCGFKIVTAALFSFFLRR